MKIVVLCGGLSPERQVSLISGGRVAQALRSRGHHVACVDLSCDLPPEGVSFSTAEVPMRFGTDRPVGEGVLRICRAAEIVFLALHGGIGEDGHLQALFDCYGIRYTGASARASTLAMDKGVTRALLAAGGLPTARGVTVTAAERASVATVPLPSVVKPCSCGSSVGIAVVTTEEERQKALDAAFAIEERVVVEERLLGRELTVGILRGKTLPAVEIRPKEGFYDYDNKYLPGRTVELCPAPLSEAESELLSQTARRAAALLQIDRYCRVDLILSEGVPYCLEVNTLPGMTPTSLLPQEAAAVGLSYADLCLAVIDEAMGK